MSNGIILTLTGPSGSGKTQLVHELCTTHGFAKLVSITTRPMRPGEIEGKDYYYIDDAAFTALEQNEGLVQATVFNGFSYGTTLAELERVSALGKVPTVIVEPSGIPQFAYIAKQHNYDLRSVFLTADPETLIERYLRRMQAPANDNSRLRYHAKRIAAIHGETNWGGTWSFDLRLVNSVDSLNEVKRLAELIGEIYGCQGRDAA